MTRITDARFKGQTKRDPRGDALRALRKNKPATFSLGDTLRVFEPSILFLSAPDGVDTSDPRSVDYSDDRIMALAISSPTYADAGAYQTMYDTSLESDLTFLQVFEQYLMVMSIISEAVISDRHYIAAVRSMRLGDFTVTPDEESALSREAGYDQENSDDRSRAVKYLQLRLEFIKQRYLTLSRADHIPDRSSPNDLVASFPDYVSEIRVFPYSARQVEFLLRCRYDQDLREFAIADLNPSGGLSEPRSIEEVQNRILRFLMYMRGRVVGYANNQYNIEPISGADMVRVWDAAIPHGGAEYVVDPETGQTLLQLVLMMAGFSSNPLAEAVDDQPESDPEEARPDDYDKLGRPRMLTGKDGAKPEPKPRRGQSVK